MAADVKALTGWRRSRDVERHQHTKEVVRQELDPNAKAALVMMAQRIERLERILGGLADEAGKAG